MKAQASLEFLMNYGWAIIIIVVVVSALLVMNIFNPSAFFEDSNAVQCYETTVHNDTIEHCNTTCTCDIVCLGIDNDTIKR